MRPDFSKQRVFADQFQRNGVLLGQRFLLFGMATPVRSVEEEAAALLAGSGFTGIFEIFAAAKTGGVG
jgi:hypothetical protein